MSQPARKLRIAYLAPELGAVTSTFIYREIEALRRLDVEVIPFSTYRPKDAVISDEARSLIDSTQYLYDCSLAKVLASGLALALRKPLRFMRTKLIAFRDALVADVPSWSDRAKLFWHFCVGCALARHLLRRRIHHVHAHFAHVPTSIAMYASLLSGVPYSFTAHANDIFERPTALREKVARSAFSACISEYNRKFLTAAGCDPNRLCVVRCGLDPAEYAWREPRRVEGPARLLCVGRLVEKKGVAVLVDALALLRNRNIAFRCRIAGDGPLLPAIRQAIADKSLEETIELLGSQPQERVRELFSESDILVLPCVVAKSGDQDGIPVVLMEAMALGVPVISTYVSGIPELVQDGKNGLLAQPGDAESLASRLEALIRNPELGRELAVNARETVAAEFTSERNAAILKKMFENSARSSAP